MGKMLTKNLAKGHGFSLHFKFNEQNKTYKQCEDFMFHLIEHSRSSLRGREFDDYKITIGPYRGAMDDEEITEDDNNGTKI